MLTTKLHASITADSIGVDQQYFDQNLKGKSLIVDWCSRESFGVIDSKGEKYTFDREQLEGLQYQTVGQEQLKARLV